MGEIPVNPPPLDGEDASGDTARIAMLEAALAKSLRVINHLEDRVAAPQDGQLSAPVAIIGMACRFPGGANDPESFWRLLCAATDASGPAPAERWPDQGGPRPRGYFLDRVPYGLDDRLFRLSPEEIRSLDPQQRLLLELAWEGFEDAGIPQAVFGGSRTGVFIGAEKADFMRSGLYSGDPGRIGPYTATGVALSAAAGRLAYMFDLRGPCTALDAACASSLVAIDQACASLRRGACDVALAGAVSLMLAPEPFTALDRLGALSADGRCKTFSAAADGYARGEGGAVLVLKPLAAALAAGDRVHGVLLGSAVRHGGRGNGLTAPSQPAQQAVIRAALDEAGVTPDDIDYLEAHGTGTPLGDPIEMEAVEAVFGRGRAAPLRVGSVKTNLGHLETAAGMAGVVKVLLCLRHGSIAPHLHLGEPSPHIPWSSLPVALPTAAEPWPARPGRRRLAGVSAFGFTGTVAHLILAEAPVAPEQGVTTGRDWHVVTVSGRGEAALAANMAALAATDTKVPLADLAWSANSGRTPFEYRAAVVARTGDDLAAAFAGPRILRGHVPAGGTAPRIAFAFTGQGAQYSGMGRGLYDTAPVFRAAIDRCAEGLRQHLDQPLQEVLFGTSSGPDALDDTACAQPAIFAFGVALAELWRSWGIRPALLLGHSVGEFAAAHLAGVLSLDDALALVAARGRLVRAHAPAGAMAVVLAPWDRAAAVLRDAGLDTVEEVVAAAHNAPARITIAGAPGAIARASAALLAAGIGCRPLGVSHAFHAPLLRPVVAPFRTAVAAACLQAPRVPVVSGMTGRIAAPGEIEAPDYWSRHLLEPVRFADAVATVAEAGIDFVIEIGPAPVLTGLARQCPASAEGGPAWLPSLTGAGEEWPALLGTLARLHLGGAVIDWSGLEEGQPRRRVSLPTYRFQRRHEAPPAPVPTPPPRPADQSAPNFAEVALSFDAVTRLGRAALRVAAARLGLFGALEDSPTVSALSARLGVVPAYDRLFAWVVDILAKDGALAVDAGRVRLGGTAPDTGETPANVIARHPDMAAMVRLLSVCLDAYPDVLRGLRNPIEILFPGGSMDLVESVYQTGAVCRHFNALVAREVAAAAIAAGPSARLIEIGAGTGGTTQAVLAALAHLAGGGLRYACTDVSPAFARRLETRFATTHPFTDFATLDIERDVVAQGFAPGGYDVVVAANVLHATRNMAGTLAQAARLLRPGGRLILNEVTRAHECVGLTFGLTPGWWLYEDAAIRLPHAPVLGLDGWRHALDQAGFSGIDRFGLAGDDMDIPIQAVMVSRLLGAPAMRDGLATGDGLAGLIERITGIVIGPEDAGTNLFELGLDSLLLMQVKQGIAQEFGVEVEMGQFYAELATPARLAAFMTRNGTAAPVAVATVPVARAPTARALVLSAPIPAMGVALPPAPLAANGLQRVIEQQMELMRRHLDLLAAAPVAGAVAIPPSAPAPYIAPSVARAAPARITAPALPLGPRQRAFIEDLVRRHTARTARSKAYAAEARPVLGDWIATIGFRPELKEMIYPIVSVASQGSHIRDLDGNDYVDLAMGFGVGFFGHSPPFVVAALRERLDRGFELATQSDLAAETARLVSELTGCERVVFSNTGSEAVMTAFRLARTVTGRRRIAHFKSAFHGFYDGVMAVGGQGGAVPMVPGIVPAQVEDVMVLDYGSPEALLAIEAAAGSLAGVLVEPVQSRNPELQPLAFLQELRRITERHGIALIFDEMVTGFRIHPGGAQAHFGITADIVTYGKMAGGGMPVSIVAGKARFIDAIDGGPWQFGDASRPSATMTFFGGTFCRHPLAIAAMHACMRYMRDQGPALQEGMNRRTADLAGRLNAVFRDGGAPFRVAWFASQFQVRHALPTGETFQSLELSVFFFLLMGRGIYTWERRVCFLSIAHDDADLDRVVEAARESVAEMREAGFFGDPPSPRGQPSLPEPAATPPGAPRRIALTPGQGDLAFRAAQGAAASAGFAEPLVLDLNGEIDASALQRALDAVVARHDALRLTRVDGTS
ncbi:MAG: amino acid adenylation protein, partial [Roseomonas sp.]|nr:amino acid adenylation protein [Roseomonas sp.]